MSHKIELNQGVFDVSLNNARTICDLSANISCEGLRYEMCYLSAWITIHVRKSRDNDSPYRQRINSIKQAVYLSKEILRCLSYAHDSGYLSTTRYRALEESYRWINAHICQLEKETVAYRWLGLIIKLYHGENTKKGGSNYEKNDRLSIDGSDGLIKLSRVRANRVRYKERQKIPSSRM